MRKITEKIFASKYWWIALLLALFAVNYLASIIHARFDLTKERRYTLSKTTKELLGGLDETVQIDVFLKGEFPTKFRKLTNGVEEFLVLLKESKSSKLQYRFIAPDDEILEGTGITWGDSLKKLGATPINLKAQVKTGESSSYAYPFAIVKYKNRQELVTLFSVPPLFSESGESPEKVINSAEALLEYTFAKALDGLVSESKPMIAYSIGNGEPQLGREIVNGAPVFRDGRTADLEYSIRQNYELFTFNLNKLTGIPDTFKVLLIVKPTLQFSEDEKLKIDQYVMRGGKVLLFIDNLIAEQDSLRFDKETIAYDRNLNLTDQLFKYGVRINTDLIMDLQCDFMPFVIGGSADKPQFEFLKWNYYPLFESKGNHSINKNTGLVSGRFVNSIDTIAAEGIKKTPLLSTSSNSRIISTPALISINENRNVPEDIKFAKKDIPVAYLLEGKFTSIYRNRLSQPQLDTLKASGTAFIDKADKESKIIVVADGDIVLNDISPKDGPLPMGMNYYTAGTQYEYQFANRNFLLNCLEYIANKPGIIETRNKDIVLRLLDSQKVKEQKTTWQFINIALPVLLVILVGWIYQQVRKRKYAA